MAKNDPLASVETLLHTTGPSKADVQAARIGLDRLRLWVRGDTSVKLDDSDILALENVAIWLREGAVLNAASVRLTTNALRLAVSALRRPHIYDPDSVIETLGRVGEVLHGE